MAGVPPPPRQLEVGRFAAARAGELRSLHEAVSARLSGRFQQPRSARRRTTGHLPSKRRRRGGDAAAGEGGEGGEGERKDVARQSRRVRRRRELAGNPAEGFSVAGDGARRLRTHLWHAKRFSMERRWGFVLPVGAQGSGRGSRAVLKWLKNGTVVHDASYFIPIQLDGPEESLLSILRMLLSPSSGNKLHGLKHRQDQVMRGVCYENAMLCHIDGPRSQIIAPVTYMWRPFSQENGKLETIGDPTNSPRLVEGSCSCLQRQLWIWIHPASLDQGLNAIRYACEKQMQDSGGVVNCFSLEGKIARLDVMGCKALQSLKSLFRPNSKMLCTSGLSTSTDPPLDSSTGSKESALDHAEVLQPSVILSMIVQDPREISTLGMESTCNIVTPNQENKLSEEDLVPNDGGAPLEEKNTLSSMCMHSTRHHLLHPDCRELWDSSHKINPPVAEEIFCMEKHHRHMKFFCLDSGNNEGNTTQEKNCFSQSCPVFLLKHAKGVFSLGWSVILPLSWVKPFWLCLVSHGARAIGLRERRWIASKFKMPCFPYDYPDSKAYSLFMAQEAAAFDKANGCRPPSKRLLRVPVPPLWHCIMSTFCKGGGFMRGSKEDDLNHDFTIFPECSIVNTNSEVAQSSSTNVVAPCQLLVPRTIQLLRQYVKEFDMKYMSSLSDMETDAGQPNFVSDDNAKITCSESELCLVRVLIRAFKEGSFEEGAVVCAPFPSDLSAWKTRSEEEEEFVEKWELQLPQSHITSYFSWLDPKDRNLQLPKDDTAVKAFRWPIGFITAGFVHGSSGQDAVAVAFCEAKLLAALRREQWSHEGMQCQDIYVLVRNARSAAYRRALATVVLEQQEEDLAFL